MTIEQALQDAGEILSRPSIAQRAREVVEAGETYEITVTVTPSHAGTVVTTDSRIKSQKESHGRLIKLE
jgi:hypothetical protein